ncbi:MAG: insulinase family protein [Lachnospiraceae bacterium]|nr:insulinase family protein [Lachnospiraceae bacterium]
MTKEQRLESVKELKAYTVLEHRRIDDLNSIGVLLKHVKTGARVALLINDDDNKVFYIGFRTPPTDSTGVAHIIEHTVLCGSDKYPVKDPFIELAKGSLNTFLNAMTFPDKTVYPVASCNDKDFDNLTDVYLDAVFHPNIYKERKIFEQEGWHYELEDENSELKINGVVYNEMRGAFSSPDDVVEREIMNTLFPDTPYGVESGGDPDNIPDLTYENFLDFHSRYYHPSNSYIYLYGDCDMARKLDEIDRDYLSGFDELDIDSSINVQQSFDEVIYKTKDYPVAETDDGHGQAYLTWSAVVSDNNLDPEEYIAFEVLDYAIAGTPGSPLKTALVTAGIGRDVYSEYSNGTKQPYFSVIAKDTDFDRQDEFISVIDSVLGELADGALDHTTLLAAINLFEFKYREADFGSYPKGLMIGLKALDSWLYDEEKPFVHVISNEVYSRLKEKVDTGYFEKLIRDRLIDNRHKAVVAVIPKPGLTGIRDKELAERLEEYKQSLSNEELKAIIDETHALAGYQESEDTPEALATIPMLRREDMRKTSEPFVYERTDSDGIETVYHDIFTNGIGYLRFSFRLKNIPEENWVYVGLLKNVLGMMDTDSHSYSDLYTQISLNTGGITPITDIYVNAYDPDDFTLTFDFEAKALYDKLNCAIDLIKEIAHTTHLEDKTRLKEIIDETLSGLKAAMTSAGHALASNTAGGEFSMLDSTVNSINGVPFLRMLEKTSASYDEMYPETVEKLKETAGLIFRPENFLVDYTGSRDSLESIRGHISDFASALNTGDIDVKGAYVSPTGKTVGYTGASQVQFVARCGDFRKAGLEYTGALKVLKVIMGYDYLWTQVRVRGGAYGCMCAFSRSGKGSFVSYRDPNLARTVEVFEQAADYVRNFEADERTITQYIIGAIADLDVPRTPRAKGGYGRAAYMSGIRQETIQQERDELLATEPETIRSLAAHIDAIMDTKAYCVVGGEDKVKECYDSFDLVVPLFGNC